MSPLACSSTNKDICLVYTKTMVWDCRIIELWMAWYASTVLQSSSHDPIMIHQHNNISPSTWDLCTYTYVSSIEYRTQHLVANSDVLTLVNLISPLKLGQFTIRLACSWVCLTLVRCNNMAWSDFSLTLHPGKSPCYVSKFVDMINSDPVSHQVMLSTLATNIPQGTSS